MNKKALVTQPDLELGQYAAKHGGLWKRDAEGNIVPMDSTKGRAAGIVIGALIGALGGTMAGTAGSIISGTPRKNLGRNLAIGGGIGALLGGAGGAYATRPGEVKTSGVIDSIRDRIFKNELKRRAEETMENVPQAATLGAIEGGAMGTVLGSPSSYFIRPSKSEAARKLLMDEWKSIKSINPQVGMSKMEVPLSKIFKQHLKGGLRGAAWTGGGLSALQLFLNIARNNPDVKVGSHNGTAPVLGMVDAMDRASLKRFFSPDVKVGSHKRTESLQGIIDALDKYEESKTRS